MKKSTIALLLTAALSLPALAELTPEQKQTFEALGWLQGNNMRQQIQSLPEQSPFTAEEAAAILAGTAKGIAEDKPSFDKEAMQEKIQAMMAEKQKAMQEKMAELEKKAQEDMKNYFAELDKNPAVKKTESGLRYEIVAEGEGAKPKATDKVKVHYTGKLTNGQTFDSSVERKAPIVFALNEVIPGWTEGVQLIGKGGKVKLYIPADLGYGEAGAPPVIPPNAPLVFDVELLDINPAGE